MTVSTNATAASRAAPRKHSYEPYKPAGWDYANTKPRAPPKAKPAQKAGPPAEILHEFFTNRQLLAHIPAEDVHNMDDAGFISGLPDRRVVYAAADLDVAYATPTGPRRSCSVIECVSAAGSAIEPLLVFNSTFIGSDEEQKLDSDTVASVYGAKYTCSGKGFVTGANAVAWLRELFDPQTCHRRDDGSPDYSVPRLLILDGASAHTNRAFLELSVKLGIKLLFLPPFASHFQPLDVAVFGPMKDFYATALRKPLEDLPRFISGFLRAREPVLATKNIQSGFSATGIHPINRDIMLRAPRVAMKEAVESYNKASMAREKELLGDDSEALPGETRSSSLESEHRQSEKDSGRVRTPQSLEEFRQCIDGLKLAQKGSLDSILRFAAGLIAENDDMREILLERGADPASVGRISSAV